MPWIFGPGFNGHPAIVQMRELKSLDVKTRATAFRARTEAYFLRQVDALADRRVRAPFPLAVMTCVGIEMIGSYKYGDAAGDQNQHFKRLVKDMSSRFATMKSTPDGKQTELSVFLYKGFRNSLAHGFYGKWVFITDDEKKTTTFRYSPYQHLVVLNVDWFYRRFREVATEYLDQLTAATNPSVDPLRTFCTTFERNFSVWI